MSIGPRRPYEKALLEAEAFVALLNPKITCREIKIAGSIRRHRPEVGDVDIVAIPIIGPVTVSEDLLGPVTVNTNLLWLRLDDLLKAGTVKKNIRSDGSTCWGDTVRSVDYRGNAFDVTLADEHNFGPKMAIRTGPAELSKLLVTEIPKRGYKVENGFKLYEVASPSNRLVEHCTEEQFFKAAGITMKRPELR